MSSSAPASPARRDALAAVPLPDEVARDPPVGQVGETLLVLLAALDPRQLARGPELAPAEAVVAVEDERGVRRPGPDALELALAVASGVVPRSSSWNPMHQQPPKTPLFASTSAANASQVDSSSAWIA